MLPQVRILNAADFTGVMELDQYSQLTYTRRWQDLDEFELSLSGDSVQGQRLIELGVIPARNSYVLAVYLDSALDFAGFIDVCEGSLTVEGNEWRLSGRGLDRLLSDRVILPPFGSAHDSYFGRAETIMKDLVDRQCVNVIASGITGVANTPGVFIDVSDDKRSIPNLSVENDAGLGGIVSFDGRFQRVDEALQEISRVGGDLGFSVEIDDVNHQMLFTVSQGNDRSQTVIFDFALGNLKSMEYALNGLDAATATIIGGQGEGNDRVLFGRGTDGNTPIGLARREIFIDARDLETAQALFDRSDAKLAERSVTQTFSAVIKQGVRPSYKTDWDLGDIVTIKNALWGIESQVRIFEVAVSLAAGHEVEITPQFARQKVNLGDRISRFVTATSRS